MTNKLAKCRTCDREVAVKAKTCPHCGENRPTKKKGRLGKIILIGFGCLFVMQMIVGTFASKQLGPLRLHSSASSVSGNWGIERSTSAMDDSVTIITQTEALAPVDAWLKQVKPSLRIQCKENKTEVLFIAYTDFTSVLGEYGRADVRIRIDDGKASNELWGKSTDGEAIFAPNPISLLKRMKEAKTLKVQFNPFNKGLVTAEFDLTGLKLPLEEIAAACKWKP